MFDPEFTKIVGEIDSSKEIINSKKYDISYKNKMLENFKEKIKYFYGYELNEKLLDVIYHDMYKLVFESKSRITPELAKDGDVTINISEDEILKGFITKKIATTDNPNAYNLYIGEKNIIKKYNFYNDAVIMVCIINNQKFIKTVRVNKNNILEYTLFRKTDDQLIKLIESDEYNIKDVLDVYISCKYNDEIIKIIFSEIYIRKPYVFPERTRK